MLRGRVLRGDCWCAFRHDNSRLHEPTIVDIKLGFVIHIGKSQNLVIFKLKKYWLTVKLKGQISNYCFLSIFLSLARFSPTWNERSKRNSTRLCPRTIPYPVSGLYPTQIIIQSVSSYLINSLAKQVWEAVI